MGRVVGTYFRDRSEPLTARTDLGSSRARGKGFPDRNQLAAFTLHALFSHAPQTRQRVRASVHREGCVEVASSHFPSAPYEPRQGRR